MAKLCRKCQEYNRNRGANEIRYCEECARNNTRMYIQQRKKPQVDYLYELMVEKNVTEISNCDKELIIEALEKSSSLSHRITGSYLGSLMNTTRGMELFEDTGNYYFPSCGRYYKVYKIKK